uniref:Uncharacterized protein n=1 Tax=Chromera velia CCMP2878 TaxID=1169474 RepID=A0A0G4F3A7_9ALVE|eukprot:Cvel_14864.t1-p1 / transcript=Cvel_14864.t1 / gene=Cvel_14864 / organism=Chromera_velia_CCMP2878 / gene_product=hypothetical protein / transcript_product=hypothetical protein / location=Cvel_scaffold1075:260-6677(-) / protein_length=266 / sequence_SO=supercontig / SO=protein_coding / is_pseudo=false
MFGFFRHLTPAQIFPPDELLLTGSFKRTPEAKRKTACEAHRVPPQRQPLTMVRFFAALCAASLGVARVSGQGDPFGGDGDGYCSEWTVPAGSGYTVEGQLQVSPGGDFTRFEGKLIVKKGGALNTTDTFIGTMTQGTECLDTRTPIGGGSWIDDATNLPATFTIPVTSDTTDGVRSFDERSTYQVAVNGTANSFMIYSNTGWPVGCCVMHSWGAYLSQSPAPCSEVPCKTFTPADSEKKWFVATMVIIFVMVLPAMAAGVCLLMYR